MNKALKSVAASLQWFAVLTTLRLCSQYAAAYGGRMNECLTEQVVISFIRFFLICIYIAGVFY